MVVSQCFVEMAMGVNLYTFVGARVPTMAQMGTHNGFTVWVSLGTHTVWAPTIVLIIVQ